MVGNLEMERARIFLKSSYPAVDLEVTLMVDDWKDWQVTLKKDILTSSFKETSFPFDFTGEAAEKLETLFNYFYGNAQAQIEIWTSWDDNGAITKETYDLDFSTYDKSDTTVSISCRSINLRTLVKKNGGTEFSILMADVASQFGMRYVSKKVRNVLRLRRADTTIQDRRFYDNDPEITRYFSLYNLNVPLFTFLDSDITVKDHLEYFEEAGVAPVKVTKTATYTISYDTKGELAGVSFMYTSPIETLKTQLDGILNINNVQNVMRVVYTLYNGNTPLTTYVRNCSKVVAVPPAYDNPDNIHYVFHENRLDQRILTWTGELAAGAEISLRITVDRYPTTAQNQAFEVITPSEKMISAYQFFGTGTLEIEYYASKNIVRNFPVVRPSMLLKTLLSRMGVTKNISVNVLAGHINDVVFLPKDVIVGIINPEITLSYNTLLGFFKMLCCDVRLNEDSADIISMYGESGVYDQTLNEGINYGEEDCADLRTKSYSELSFCEIEIGSKAEQKEENFANVEFNVAATYITKTESQAKLDLTTSIRTDTTGFEKMLPIEPNGNNDTDKTIFAFDVTLVNGSVFEPRETVTVPASQTYVNGIFAPRMLLVRWLPILNAGADVFLLSSSTKNTNIMVNGQLLTTDVSQYVDGTLRPVLHPAIYDIATSDGMGYISREHLNGALSFNYNGTTYYGFAITVNENPLERMQKEIQLLKMGGEWVTFPYGILTLRPELIKTCTSHVAVSMRFTVVGGIGLLNTCPITFSQPFVSLSYKTFVGTSGTLILNIAANTGAERTCKVYITLPNNVQYLVGTIIQKVSGAASVDVQMVELAANKAYTDDSTTMIFSNKNAQTLTSIDLAKVLGSPVFVYNGLYNFGASLCIATKIKGETTLDVFSFGNIESEQTEDSTENYNIYIGTSQYVLPVKFKAE